MTNAEEVAESSTNVHVGVDIDLKAPRLELNLSWSEVVQTVEIDAEDGAKEDKTLVDKVSGRAQPGKLTVIMGPSGAGKTTLLNCLAGRTRPSSGDVHLNGEPWRASLTKLSAYVEQESLMFPLLTVQEYLTVSAYLRIKEALTDEERAARFF